MKTNTAKILKQSNISFKISTIGEFEEENDLHNFCVVGYGFLWYVIFIFIELRIDEMSTIILIVFQTF